MSNPGIAYAGTKCDICEEFLQEDDDVYFHDGMKYCISCAEEEDIICSCGNYKKPEYDQCYECHKN